MFKDSNQSVERKEAPVKWKERKNNEKTNEQRKRKTKNAKKEKR